MENREDSGEKYKGSRDEALSWVRRDAHREIYI